MGLVPVRRDPTMSDWEEGYRHDRGTCLIFLTIRSLRGAIYPPKSQCYALMNLTIYMFIVITHERKKEISDISGSTDDLRHSLIGISIMHAARIERCTCSQE
jgi:hypothetical protein